MNRYRSADGEERLWFDDDEIERVVEDELRRANLMPTLSSPVTDLERFIENYLRCSLDQYGDLPAEVLGITAFRRGQKPAITINKNLTGSALDEDDSPPGILGRWRATVAHEACHVLLHRILYDLDPDQGELFSTSTEGGPQLMRCLKRDVGYAARQADWREVQANKGMAAMLMPTRVFKRVVRQEVQALGMSLSSLTPGAPATAVLVRSLAQKFSVSRQAAEIRLRTTGVVRADGAPSLIPN
jgi:hypothetical protein